MEARQQLSTIETERALPLILRSARSNRTASQRMWRPATPARLAATDDDALAEGPAQLVDHLVQRDAGAALGELGPEQAEKGVAPVRAGARRP